MLFSSPIFLFFFLPVVFGLYYIIPKRFANLFLLLFSLGFYAWGEVLFVLVMLFSILVNYVTGLILERTAHRKAILSLNVFFNLLILIIFKYLSFILEMINDIYPIIPLSVLSSAKNIPLPLGISFFTFQAMSYTIDLYRREVKPQKNIVNLALYISLFPQLIAGPILRYSSMAQQLVNHNLNIDFIFEGIKRFIVGLSKKLILANSLGEISAEIFSLDSSMLNSSISWLGIICYTLQIYFDFSGYSDMAIGLGRMFGFKFIENFNCPYIASSMTELWKRWHISLSTWFRDYLYIPLGGNRCSKLRNLLNLLIVFVLCGLWHGASYNFLIWGLINGFFLYIERLFPRFFSNRTFFHHLYAVMVFSLALIFFRLETLDQSYIYFKSLFLISPVKFSQYNFTHYLNFYSIVIILFSVYFSIFQATWNQRILASLNIILGRYKTPLVIFSYVFIFAISIILIASSSYKPFIYFRF